MSRPEQMDGGDVAQERGDVAQERDAFAERLLQSLSGLFDRATIVIGGRLGLYRTLAAEGPLTPSELAARTGTNERYVHVRLERAALSSHGDGGSALRRDRHGDAD